MKMILLFLRWIFFFPIAYLGITLLDTLMYFSIQYCRATQFKPSLFNCCLLVFGIIAVGVPLVSLWFWGLFVVPGFAVSGICPKPVIGAAIFILLFGAIEVNWAITDWHMISLAHLCYEFVIFFYVVWGAFMGASHQPRETISGNL